MSEQPKINKVRNSSSNRNRETSERPRLRNTAYVSSFFLSLVLQSLLFIANTQIFSDKIPELDEKQEDLLHQVKNVRTTPRDQRFPSQNQALHCWNRYNEWLVCLKQNAEDDAAEKCQVYRQYSTSICPFAWVENWDEAREEGTFMGIQQQNPE